MSHSAKPGPWQVTVLTGEVLGGRCNYCNAPLSAEMMATDLYRAHQGHVSCLSISIRILAPQEYRNIELRVPADFFIGQKRPILEVPFQVPCIVLKLYCNSCVAEKSPRAGDDVLRFRRQHGRHIDSVRIRAVLQNFGGRAVQQTICVIGHSAPSSDHAAQPTTPSKSVLERAARLRRLARSLRGLLVGVRCNACRSRYPIKDPSETIPELSLHQSHWESVHVHVRLYGPEDYAGRELEIPAFPFSFSSVACADGVTIDSVLVKLFRQHGGPAITPSNPAEVARFIEAPAGRRNQPRFQAMIRGHGGRLFQCDLPIIHVHSASRSFPASSRLEDVALPWPMEQP